MNDRQKEIAFEEIFKPIKKLVSSVCWKYFHFGTPPQCPECMDCEGRSYENIIKKRTKKKYSKEHKTFQLIRRGRYVEFNLLYDRGTIFGLQSGGRAESILMSMPPSVIWTGKRGIKLNKFEKDLKKYL